uniref:Uncharacterized protein n=1 Tax=viral metagenome TaxID=1070528 RepID=A0A6M3IJE6_9ZZZZ
MTPRQQWAMERNWLIRRLKGALSIFSASNKELIESLVSLKDAQRLYMIESDIKYLIKEISKSKYKE